MLKQTLAMPNFTIESLGRLTPEKRKQVIHLLEIRERNIARAGLIKFSQYVDPAQAKWYAAAHLRTIADKLERVQRREITRLIINIAPRHWKSSLVTKWQAKLLGDNPKEKVIAASRSNALAVKFSKLVKQTLQSKRYQDLYPGTKLLRGSDSAEDWLLEGGYQSSYRAVGTGGGIAGEGATVLVLDDVSDPNKQPSETETVNDWEWYKNVIRTRLEPDGVIVVVNNRVGVNDLVGYLLDRERNDSADPPGDWEVIDIPAQDPVTGEFLWLERFGAEYYQKLQNDTNLWRVQYQQKPTVAEGNLIKQEWFEYVEALPSGAKWTVRPWDIAFTEKQTQKHDPDWTFTVLGCKWGDVVYVGHPELFRKDIDGITTEIVTRKYMELGIQYGMGRVAIKSSVVKALKAAGFSINEYEEHTDKVARASAWINWASNGRIKLVGTKEQWERTMSQWLSFPAGHDDAVDGMSGLSQMLNLIINAPVVSGGKEAERGYQDELLRTAYGR
jgi:predicted phage terminase large subunit-like protein